MQLVGRRVVVTGGSSGIGAATARAYAREGARVVILDLDEKGGREVARTAGPSVQYACCDVRQREGVFEAFDEAARQMGGLDVLVNAAGIDRYNSIENIDDEQWDEIFDVHVKGTLHTNQAALRHLRDHGGRILNFGSAIAIRGQPGAAHYAAAKGAVMAFTRTAALEWGRHGITVNTLLPAMWTPMYETFRANMTPEQLEAHDRTMRSTIPLGGRLGDPDRDLAPVMVFLASEGARFLTGQIFCVDGGMLMLD